MTPTFYKRAFFYFVPLFWRYCITGRSSPHNNKIVYPPSYAIGCIVGACVVDGPFMDVREKSKKRRWGEKRAKEGKNNEAGEWNRLDCTCYRRCCWAKDMLCSRVYSCRCWTFRWRFTIKLVMEGKDMLKALLGHRIFVLLLDRWLFLNFYSPRFFGNPQFFNFLVFNGFLIFQFFDFTIFYRFFAHSQSLI